MRTIAAAVASVALSLLLALPARADATYVDPPDPTSAEPVTLHFAAFGSCPRWFATISGFEIRVTGYDHCLSPPTLIHEAIELGRLPTGTYTVKFVDYSELAPFVFHVLDANGSVKVTPSIGVATGGTIVLLETATARCMPPCVPSAVTFGGVPATDLAPVDGSHFQVKTPPHAPGAVEVRVTTAAGTDTSYAYRYYDPHEAPSSKFFEKVLIPVVLNGPGARGSEWVTDVVVRNNARVPIEPWRPAVSINAIAPSIPARLSLPDAPAGMFLFIPRDVAADLAWHASVRDTSRAEREWGTELPVVRESGFSARPLDILDVPSDPRYRVMLRVYALDPASYPRFIDVAFYSMESGTRARPPVAVGIAPTIDPQRPGSGSIADITAVMPPGKIGIRITGPYGGNYWAFATVTNNETQSVTIYTPQ